MLKKTALVVYPIFNESLNEKYLILKDSEQN